MLRVACCVLRVMCVPKQVDSFQDKFFLYQGTEDQETPFA